MVDSRQGGLALMSTKMRTGMKSSAAGTALSLAILSRFMIVVAHRKTHFTLSLGVWRKKCTNGGSVYRENVMSTSSICIFRRVGFISGKTVCVGFPTNEINFKISLNYSPCKHWSCRFPSVLPSRDIQIGTCGESEDPYETGWSLNSISWYVHELI